MEKDKNLKVVEAEEKSAVSDSPSLCTNVSNNGITRNETGALPVKKEKKPLFSTRSIAGMAIFTALAYGVSFLEFSLFPTSAVFFLKLDFSNAFIMLAGFMYGPLAALFVGILKELLCLIGSSTFGVGQIANMIIILVYVLPPAIVYTFKKGIKTVTIMLVLASVLQTAAALVVNKFITFPLYGMAEIFDEEIWLIIAFNVIKAVSVSMITLLLYKRIGYLFEKINIKETSVDTKAIGDLPDDKKESSKRQMEIISSSVAQTEDIAVEYAKTLNKGDVVLLAGDLGAGKTAFVKGVAKYFGLDGVTSPTYAYLNVYGDLIYHYDCYRLSCGEDAAMLGLTDYFGGDNICFIEWAENILDVLPSKVKKVVIEKIDDQTRKITL